MIDFAINIEMLYPGMDICEKIERVHAAGFQAIEFWGWQDKDLAKLKATCKHLGVKVRAFSGTGDWSLCDREHSGEYIDWIKKTIEVAKDLECDTLILFPNHFTPNGCADFRSKYSHEAMIANITATLTRLAPVLEAANMTVLLEPICNIGSDGGMSVTDTSVGADIVRAVGSPSVKLLCDVFHMQIMHGKLLQNITDNMDIVPYVHIADAPDRHEPGTGEINFDYLLPQLKANSYDSTICFEYVPAGEAEEGFPAIKRLCDMLA